jgi:hypothetical protein
MKTNCEIRMNKFFFKTRRKSKEVFFSKKQLVDPMIPRPQKKLVVFAPYMRVYYLKAKINFYNIKNNNNTIKLINQKLISL